MKTTTFDRTPAVGFRCARSLSSGDGGLSEPDGDLPRVTEGQMVHVAGGALAPGLDGGAAAGGAMAIAVAAFDIDVTEVTAKAYAKCIEAKRCESTLPADPAMRGHEQSHADAICSEDKPPLAGHPMNCVSAKQAAAYCAWMKKRLPTEIEWQFAAGGSDGRSLPWGQADPARKACWDRPGGDVPYTGTCPVATHPDDVSPLGVYDMAGNVSEWTTGKAGAGFVLKGGSWENAPRSFTSLGARTDRTNQPEGGDTIGFRCAR
jgi:formylglycine-generating enzyme required for sulfatase activity